MAEDKNLDDFTVPDAVEYLEGRLAFLEQVILITLSALPEEKRREAIATMNNINVGNLIREAIDAGHSPLYAKGFGLERMSLFKLDFIQRRMAATRLPS